MSIIVIGRIHRIGPRPDRLIGRLRSRRRSERSLSCLSHDFRGWIYIAENAENAEHVNK
jgi:hypothetical protein